MTAPVFRFAPSPNGYLHLGHALSALINFEMARAAGGRLPAAHRGHRRDALPAGIRAGDLRGSRLARLAWEQPVRRQSEHFDDYRAALAQLDAQGLVYPSFESRAEIAAAGRRARAARRHGRAIPTARRSIPARRSEHARRPSAQRRIAAGEPYALRLDMAAAVARAGALSWTETGAGPAGETGAVAADAAAWGDVVLARKETPTSYHLSVVVDDARQGVTHVVRGQDLFWSTSVHRLLQALLGLPAPVYRHHRLILDADGRKLSKSTHATALRALRTAGATPADIRRMVGLA